jgi:hypothetical protein
VQPLGRFQRGDQGVSGKAKAGLYQPVRNKAPQRSLGDRK